MTTETTVVQVGQYIITETGHGWQVEMQTSDPAKDRSGDVKPGQFIVQFIGYYSTFPSCLRAILSDGYKGQGKADIKRMIARQDELATLVTTAVKS